MLYNVLRYRERHAPIAIILINIGIPDPPPPTTEDIISYLPDHAPMVLLYFYLYA